MAVSKKAAVPAKPLVRKLKADLRRRGLDPDEAARRAIAAASHLEKTPSVPKQKASRRRT